MRSLILVAALSIGCVAVPPQQRGGYSSGQIARDYVAATAVATSCPIAELSFRDRQSAMFHGESWVAEGCGLVWSCRRTLYATDPANCVAVRRSAPSAREVDDIDGPRQRRRTEQARENVDNSGTEYRPPPEEVSSSPSDLDLLLEEARKRHEAATAH